MTRLSVLFVTICLCVLTLSNAAAQTDLGFKGAGLEVGFVSPADVDATIGFGVFADLGTIAIPELMLEAYLDYWSTSEEQLGFETSLRDIAVGAKAKYVFHVRNSRIRPFAGGGLGIHFLHAEATVPDQNIAGFIVPGFTIEDSSTKLGLDLGGGFYVPVNPRMDFLTELWFGIVSDVNQMSVKVGVLYRMGS